MNLLPMFNICYADRAGNIFLHLERHRAQPAACGPSRAAVHATRTADVWTRIHADDRVAATVESAGRLRAELQFAAVPDEFASTVGSGEVSRLISRPTISACARSTACNWSTTISKLSLDDVIRLKHSPRMLLADRVKERSDRGRARHRVRRPKSKRPLRVLDAWDNTVAADSRGGTLFADWWDRYYDKTQRDLRRALERRRADEPRRAAWRIERRAVQGLPRGARRRAECIRATDVTWGEAHRIRKGNVDLPVSGGPGTDGLLSRAGISQQIATAKWSPTAATALSSPSSSASRHERLPTSPTAKATSPTSPHFADQAPLFSANRLKPAAFTEAEIRRNCSRPIGQARSEASSR